MSLNVIRPSSVAKYNFDKQRSDVIKFYAGNADHNLKSLEPTYNEKLGDGMIVNMGSETWKDSAGYHKLWNEIEDVVKKIKMNAAQAPTYDQLAALIPKIYIDITRRYQEAGDLTSLFCDETTNPASAQTVNLRDIYKYRGKMKKMSGSGDSVNLIQQKLGQVFTFDLDVWGIGWADTLNNMLYNSLHTMDKVNQAVVDADVDQRNAETIGRIVAITAASGWDSSQQQAADTTTNASLDFRYYKTIDKAIDTLYALKDPLTDREIATPSISLLCNKKNLRQIRRVINGQLTKGGTKGEITSYNVEPLDEIDTIIEYSQGINNGFPYGLDANLMSYPGVAAGYCYLFVPRVYWPCVNKRPLIMDSGKGSVLNLSTDEYSWYRVFGNYRRDFLGTSDPDTSLAAGYGAIVEISLPS